MTVREYVSAGGATMANVTRERDMAVLGALIADLTDELLIALNDELAQERSAAVQRAVWSIERARRYQRAQGGKPGCSGVDRLVDESGKWRQL